MDCTSAPFQFKMASVRSEKPIILCTPPGPSLRSVPNVAFGTVPVFFQRLSPSGNRWCDVLGFVPAGSASSFSTLQIFRKASHLWGLLCPAVYLLGRFYSIRHVQCRTPTGVFKSGCRPSTHSILGFPFHFSLFVASSLNLWGWWHVWSDCPVLRLSSGGHGWLLPPPLSSWKVRPYRLHCLYGW